jgi:hypothetical protein
MIPLGAIVSTIACPLAAFAFKQTRRSCTPASLIDAGSVSCKVYPRSFSGETIPDIVQSSHPATLERLAHLESNFDNVPAQSARSLVSLDLSPAYARYYSAASLWDTFVEAF